MSDLDINDFFQPSAALRTSHRDQFVGRERKIVDALSGLASDGSSLCIIGERGIGKTSFAWRIKEYVQGDRSWLLERARVPFRSPEFDVIWLEIQPSHGNIFGVIADLISDRGRSERFSDFSIANELSDILSRERTPDTDKILNSAMMREFSENLKSSNHASSDRQKYNLNFPQSEIDAIVASFRNAIDRIASARNKLLVIFLDEIDRLPDKSGLGDLIKTGNQIRFCLVGVADSIDEFIISDVTKDHPSSERKIFPVLIDRLSRNEVSAFIDLASKKLEQFSIAVDVDFNERMFEYTGGFPFLIHRLFRDALLRSIQDSPLKGIHRAVRSVEIGKDQFYFALDGLINQRLDGARRYERLAKIDNAGKEAILFSMSDLDGGFIREREIENLLESSYGFIGNLIELEGQNIVKRNLDVEGERVVRFSDPILRAIVKRIKERDKRLYKKKGSRT